MRRFMVGLLLFLQVSLLSGCRFSVNMGDEERSAKPTIDLIYGEPSEHRAAEAAALAVLRDMDDDRFDKVWSEASPKMHDSTNGRVFKSVVGGLRKSAGTPGVRKLARSGFTEKMPDAPPGRYAVVIYETEFDGNSYEERAVLVRDNRRRWRLAGYAFDPRSSGG